MSATNDKGTGMTREEAKSILRNAAWLGTNEDRERIERAVELLCGETCEDAVSRGVFEQVMWERDVAIEQLKELGYGFGEKKRTGHWIETAEEYYKAVNEYGGGVNEDTPYFTDDIACSECLSMFSVIDNETERFDCCPHCGTKMVDPQDSCDTCKHKDDGWDSEHCDGCCGNHSGFEPQESEE